MTKVLFRHFASTIQLCRGKNKVINLWCSKPWNILYKPQVIRVICEFCCYDKCFTGYKKHHRFDSILLIFQRPPITELLRWINAFFSLFRQQQHCCPFRPFNEFGMGQRQLSVSVSSVAGIRIILARQHNQSINDCGQNQ